MAQFSSNLFTSEIRDLTDETQNSMAAHSLIQVGGKDIVKLLMSFGDKWSDRKYEEMIEQLNNKYLVSSDRLNLLKFANLSLDRGELFSEFIQRIKPFAKRLKKGDAGVIEKLISDEYIQSLHKEFHDKLVHEDWDLAKLTAWVESREQQKEMVAHKAEKDTCLNQVSSFRPRYNSDNSNHSNRQATRPAQQARSFSDSRNRARIDTCWNCGKEWPHVNRRCPAYGKTCRACNGRNHFEKQKKCPANPKSINTINASPNSSSASDDTVPTAIKCNAQIKTIGFLEEKRCQKDIICLGNNDLVEFMLDTGAQANVITSTTYYKMSRATRPVLKPVSCTLVSYNNNALDTAGEFKTLATWNGQQRKITVIVLNTDKNIDNIL